MERLMLEAMMLGLSIGSLPETEKTRRMRWRLNDLAAAYARSRWSLMREIEKIGRMLRCK